MSVAVELTSGMLVPDGMSTMAEVEVAFQKLPARWRDLAVQEVRRRRKQSEGKRRQG
jgi:hypothetical protein